MTATSPKIPVKGPEAGAVSIGLRHTSKQLFTGKAFPAGKVLATSLVERQQCAMVIGMFDGTYDTGEFARALALIPPDAPSVEIAFRQSGYRTVITATMQGIGVELSMRPDWARGELAVRLDAADIALLRTQTEHIATTRVWVQAEYGQVNVKPAPLGSQD